MIKTWVKRLFLLGMAALTGISACAAPLATPTATDAPPATLPAATATLPLPSATLLPTATLPAPTATPDKAMDAEAHFMAALYQASLAYLADNPQAADAMAQQIDYVEGKVESASNACGPLSIAILRAAGFLPQQVSLHNIWLLDLHDETAKPASLNLLQRDYFPPQDYDYFWVEESVKTYDFAADPLQAGDWLYLLSTKTGFDHMLTVTRVDDDGAVYAVTNLDRGNGFFISEELLYHPGKPESGLFFELTERSRGMLGMTGHGGFLRIRRRAGLASLPVPLPALDAALNPDVIWHGLVKEVSSADVMYAILPNQKFHPASMIKIPLAMVALKTLADNKLAVTDFAEKGWDGRSFDQLFSAMLVNSEEAAAQSLLDCIRMMGNENLVLQSWGVMDTSFAPRQTTAYDLAILLEGLYSTHFLGEVMSTYLLDLMLTQTPNDAFYLGVMREMLPDGLFYNKRGTLLSPTIVGDMGILVADDKTYIIILIGALDESGGSTFEAIKANIEQFARTLGGLLLAQPQHQLTN